jgi:hypothetical protein
MMHLSLRRAALAVALALVAGCSSSGNASTGSDVGDASVEIESLIAQVCQRDYVCEGSPAGTTPGDCVVSINTQLVGSPAECPTSAELTCLKEAAALPCEDAGGATQAQAAVAACGPCFPPMLGPDASPGHPVDIDAQF